MIYVTYSCTFCKRSKTLLRDDVRTIPDNCTITKGCLGKLKIVGEDVQQSMTPIDPKLTDWYPRGKEKTVLNNSTVSEIDQTVSLATSASGAIVIAIKSSVAPAQDTIILNVDQRKSADTEYSQYFYKTLVTTSTISGRDSSGKNLRFDAQAISESRVTVLLNGVVSSNVQLSANVVTFLSPLPVGSTVEILVFSSSVSIQKSIILTKSALQIPSSTRGSWSNVIKVHRVETVNQIASDSTWWIYSADSLSIGAGALKINSLNIATDAILLLAVSPFASADRCLNFVAPIDQLTGDYSLNISSTGKMTVQQSKVKELYPPLFIPTSSFISSDVNLTSNSSGIVNDGSNYQLKTEKVIGPT